MLLQHYMVNRFKWLKHVDAVAFSYNIYILCVKNYSVVVSWQLHDS